MSAAARRFPIGTAVAVHPGGNHRPDDHWHGRVHDHEDLDAGLLQVECTDPNGFLNQQPGHVTTVEVRQLRKTEEPDAQLTFDLGEAAA